MRNTFGQSVTLTIFGESHGPAVGVVLDGLTPGLPVDEDCIRRQLSRRRPGTAMDTARQEPDHYQILSGVYCGHTTGTPIAIVIPNKDTRSGDYTYGLARPSHADYAAYCKYHGYEDWRGGGHFSGRVTAPLVAAGAICLSALSAAGITVGTHILRCGDAWDRPFSENAAEDIAALQTADFPSLSSESARAISDTILRAKENQDSVGGITQTAVCGLPAGVGEPWFDTVESIISHAVFSVGGVKGIEFGSGFSAAGQHGSSFNDPLRMEGERVVTATNHNGGINGGITNGMPVVFQCVVKPTPSIGQIQQTVDFLRGENAQIGVHGRHDPAIIRRVCPVLDSITALALCDLLAQRYGTDCFMKGKWT